jgi:hypothetical protein
MRIPRAIKNGKLHMLEGVFPSLDAEPIGIPEDQLERYVIECGSDIVEYVPYDKADIFRDLRNLRNIVDALTSLRIMLYQNLVIVTKSINQVVKIDEVLLGPINFRS